MATDLTQKLPRAFIWRRLHSLMGLWLVLFLMEHLLVNSQAALLLGESGKGFVHAVNAIHNFPYLQAIEITLLGVPIFIHLVWGIKYLLTARSNSSKTDGSTPSLPEYGRNHAYTWQRITSWILVIMLTGHIVKFRFLEYPDSLEQGITASYFVKLQVDDGLQSVAGRLKADLYDQKAVEEEIKRSGDKAWIEKLQKNAPRAGQVVAVTDNFGTASLLVVRDTFKSPIYVGLYTIFVLAACFHAFNGLWTFLITWGVVLRMSAQRATVKMAIALMLLVTFLGLAAVWGTYWLNLRT